MAQHFATVNIGDTERVRFEVEEDYSSVGSYALDTEEQTSLAKQYEQARIESGEWIPLIAWHEHRCPCCGQWSGDECVGGIVGPAEDSDLISACGFFRIESKEMPSIARA